MQPQYHIELLGGLRVRRGARSVTRFRTRKAALLLARLALQPQLHERAALIEWLWPNCELSVGRNRLSVTLSALRRDLGEAETAIFVTSHDAVGLNWRDVAADVAAIETLHKAPTNESESDERARLRAFIEAFRGPLLAGYDDDVFASHQQQLRAAFCGAACRLSEFPAFDDGFVVGALRRAAALEPLDEAIVRALMRTLARTQDVRAALHFYAAFEVIVNGEIGEPPLRETRQLAAQLRQQLEAPLDDNDELALMEAQGNDRFFGRAAELEELTRRLLQMLDGESGRLLTLTGNVGCGKTRLALEIARRLRVVWPGEIVRVPLTQTQGAGDIAGALARALQLPRASGAPSWPRVLAALRSKTVLLVFDNFEHLVEAGAPLLAELLEAVPRVVCLVSSRRALGIAGESERVVEPLPLPEAGDFAAISSNAAVQMWVDRVHRVRPDFRLRADNAPVVARLCAALEGVPLAIELAAAHGETLSPGQMLEALQERLKFLRLSAPRAKRSAPDAQPRRHSVRAALSWSHDLLAPDAARVLRELSVFRGGWTLESARAVCQTPRAATPFWLAETHEQLSRHSLLQSHSDAENGDEVRFSPLESVRQFAGEKLAGASRHALQRRHALYFVEQCERAALERRNHENPRWLARFDREHENLRAALSWSLEHDAGLALRLAASLWWFWFLRGHIHEGRAWLQRALDNAAPTDAAQLQNTRAEALCGAGFLAWRQGELAVAAELSERALELCRASGETRGIAYSLIPLQLAHIVRGDYASALACADESLALCRESEDGFGQAFSLHLAGAAHELNGEVERAWSQQEQSRALFDAVGSREGAAYALFNRGSAEARRGDGNAAFKSCERSRLIFEQLDNREGAAYARLYGARASLQTGHQARARRAALRALAEFARLDLKWGLTMALETLALGEPLDKPHKAARATLWWSAAARLREQIGAPVPPVDGAQFAEFEQLLRDAQDAPAFEAAWENGRALPLAHIVAQLVGAAGQGNRMRI